MEFLSHVRRPNFSSSCTEVRTADVGQTDPKYEKRAPLKTLLREIIPDYQCRFLYLLRFIYIITAIDKLQITEV